MSKRKFDLVSSADVDLLPEIDGIAVSFVKLKRQRSFFSQIISHNVMNMSATRALLKIYKVSTLLSMLPYEIKLNSLRNEGQLLLASLTENSANFHKSCRNSCDKYHFERGQDRCDKKSQENAEDSCSSEDSSLRKGTRCRYESLNFVKAQCCIFCEREDDEKNLHRANTMEFDIRIRAATHRNR